VSDICIESSPYVSTVDSYDEGKALAQLAADYIRTSGTTDQLFVDYFGKTNSPVPLNILSVCPRSPGGRIFFIALLFRQWPRM
jgi:hypothetical protein